MIKVCKYLFSTTTTREYRVLKKMRKFNYYVKETGVSHKKDTQRLVEQMFFPNEQEQNQVEDDIHQYNKVEIQQIPQTVNEIFEYIKENQDYDHYELLGQICYCIRNLEQIKERMTMKRKKLESQYSQQYNQKAQIVEKIYLTNAQILEHNQFKNLLKEFVEEYDLEEILEIRRKLWFAFDNKPLLELDSQILQKLQERDQNPLFSLQFLQLLHKDIYVSTSQNYIQWFVEYFQQNNCNKKEDALYNIEQQALNILDNLKLSNQDETTQLINILYNFIHHISIPPKLIEEIVNMTNLSQLSGDLSAKLADILIESKFTNQVYLESILMNIIRQQQCQPNLIIKILKHFHDQRLFYRNQSESQIVIIEGNIYQLLFQLINTSIVDQSPQKLEELLYVSVNNGANPEIINVICSHLIKQVEQLSLVKQQDIIYNSIELGYKPNMQLLNDIFQKSLNEWKDKDVQGYITGSSISTNGNNKYVYELIKRQVQLLWSVLQSDKENKNYELINLSIHRLNQISKLDDGLITLPIQTIRLMSLINQMIQKQSMIPQKIQISNFFQKKNFKIKPEAFQHPLNSMQKLMQQKKLEFISKYPTLQYNQIINDVFYDCVYQENEKLICFKFNYINQFIKQDQYTPMRSLQQQQLLLQNIPVIEINFYEFTDPNINLFEQKLQSRLQNPEIKQEEDQYQLSDLD